MAIEVDGGTAAIASAEIISGPCSRLLTHSAGEAGAQSSYAAVQITYNGPSDTPPQCLIKLTSIAGETVVVTASATASGYAQSCCPYGSCCAQTNDIPVHHRVVFDPPAQTISFPSAQNLDGGSVDSAEDMPQTVDSAATDLADEIDGGAVEATDESTLDGALAIDAPLST